MNDMIERMAKAAYEGNRERFNRTVDRGPEYMLQPWDDEPDALREDWRQFIRDALAAGREPTKDMIEAGDEALGYQYLTHPEDAWKAMIAKALGEL